MWGALAIGAISSLLSCDAAELVTSTGVYGQPPNGNAVPPAAAQPADPQTTIQPTITSLKRYEAPAFSIKQASPFGSGDSTVLQQPHVANWILGGTAVFNQFGLQLTTEETNTEASAWNYVPVRGASYTIDLEIEVRGPTQPRTADGFAIWLADERDFGTFLRQPSTDVWALFDYKPWFKGFGVFFSTNDRANNNRPSISAAVNNGTKVIDITREIPSTDGIYFDYRNSAHKLSLNISVTPEWIKGLVKWSNEKEWRQAFAIKPDGLLPQAPFLGLTASNKRVPRGEVLLPKAGHFGDRIIIHSLEISSTDPQWAASTYNPASSMLESVAYDPTMDPAKQLRVMAEVWMKHLVPHQQQLLAHLGTLQAHQRQIQQRVEILHAYITQGQNDDEIREQLESMKKVLYKSSQDSADKLNALQGKLEVQNVEELKQKSAELHSSILQSERRALHLMLCLGGVFLGVGFCLYKRMRDMEKKHIL